MSPATRDIFCNRTLNLRAIRAIGYDLDYTLVHYRFEAWEGSAYSHMRAKLADSGWPVEDLEFDPDLVIRGLIIDVALGNIVKANRFGYVVRAFHGTSPLTYEEQRATYRRTLVDLGDDRYAFLNTLFSLSEGCMFAQLVDLFDRGELPGAGSYREVFDRVRSCIDEAHMEGVLKGEIVRAPAHFIAAEADAALALRDQKESGKRLMLISNAEWLYAKAVMEHAFDPYLDGASWRDLFDLVIVGARKPDFFAADMPLFTVFDEDNGSLKPAPGGFHGPGAYLGGDATAVEGYLGLSGDEILYVGDHVYADVRMSKSLLRWRTALILRELEDEITALEAFADDEGELVRLMTEKERLESRLARARLLLQRSERGYGPPTGTSDDELSTRYDRLRTELMALDERIAPLARAAGELFNHRWGPLLRAGNDKSHLAWQLERSADVYTSRIANFLGVTPFAYLRSSRGSLPHDPTRLGAVE